MQIETICEDPRWEAAGLDALAQRAAATVAAHLALGRGSDPVSHPDFNAGFNAALLGCDDARIATLNADFRDKPSATNVLSWPEADLSAADAGALPRPPEWDPQDPEAGFLGDMAIAYDTCTREAAAQGKPLNDHVTHLIIHGILHLLGYDHIRDLDATLMEQTETEILGNLGIDDPYRDMPGA